MAFTISYYYGRRIFKKYNTIFVEICYIIRDKRVIHRRGDVEQQGFLGNGLMNEE